MSEYNAYKYSDSESLMRGTRWAYDEEIMQATHKICLSNPKEKFQSGLPVISDGDTVYLDNSDAHSLIIGSTGSKKTRLFAMPMLELMRRAEESVVVTDPKGELYDLTAQLFEDSGYKVDVVNLRDPSHSSGWNPLAAARECFNHHDEDRAASIVNDFVASIIFEKPGSSLDPFWTQTSRAMLQGLAMMLVEGIDFFPDEAVNLATLRHLSDHFVQPDDFNDTSFWSLMNRYPEDSLARSNLNAIVRGSEKTFDNIKVSLDAPMQQLYIQKSLVSLLSRNEIQFTQLGLQKTILYLIMPDEKTTLHMIVSLIIKQCYEQLISLAQTCEGNALPYRVNFLLDEFSNLPMIPDMPAMISAARSRNIKFFLIIQGLYQLSSKYGRDDAHTIKGNCANWVFLTSRELPLLNEISELCGFDELTGEHLISVSQLQRLNKEKGEALILLGRQYPYIAHMADISEYHLPKLSPRPFPEFSKDPIPTCTIEQALENPLKKMREAPRRSLKTAREAFISGQMQKQEVLSDDFDVFKELDEKFDEVYEKDSGKPGNES